MRTKTRPTSVAGDAAGVPRVEGLAYFGRRSDRPAGVRAGDRRRHPHPGHGNPCPGEPKKARAARSGRFTSGTGQASRRARSASRASGSRLRTGGSSPGRPAAAGLAGSARKTSPPQSPHGLYLLQMTRLFELLNAPMPFLGRQPPQPPPPAMVRIRKKISRRATAREVGTAGGPASRVLLSVREPSRTPRDLWVREHHPRSAPRRPKISDGT
jgi:hypothetical protein